ncbi:MAG: START domain-containing protein [Oceanococcus sp.]
MQPRTVKSSLAKHTLLTYVWLGLLCCFGNVAPAYAEGPADESGWVLERDKDGIQVYSREVAGSALRAVRAQTQVKATLTSAVALLRDVPARPNWDTMCEQAYIHEQSSSDEELIYLHNDLPWPVTDRDMVLKRVWSFSPSGDFARVQETAVAGVIPVDPKKVRLETVDGFWEVSKLEQGLTQLRTQAHLEPGGPLPSWLINRLSVQAPYDILQRIREQLELGAYSAPAVVQNAASTTDEE